MAVITKIEAFVLNPSFSVRWTQSAKQCCLTTTIVAITDSDGVTGVGSYDAFTPGEADLSILESVRSLAPGILGRQTGCQEALAQDLRVGVIFPFVPGAMSAIDIALWDLAGRQTGLSVTSLLHGTRQEIAAYASTATLETAEEYVELVAHARADGLRAVKIHAWGDPDSDIRLLRTLRETYPDVVLLHDAEGVYTRREALKVARALESLDVRWFEAPLSDFDIEGYRELRRRVDIPILPAGYAMWDLRQFAEVLHDSPWSALRSSIGTLGISGLRRLMLLAADFGMDLEPVSYGVTLGQSAALHVMLSHDNCEFFELPYPVQPWEQGVRNPIRPDSNGMVRAPGGPGLGVDLDWEEMESRTCHRVVVEEGTA
jgi:L-alanine-DL-glutamate epimerase-like enolase superfamily enzyme